MARGIIPTIRGGKRHERLKAWIACHDVALAVYRCSRDWPATERYALASESRRAAYSAAANIAEGAAKHGARNFRHHLDIVLGSLAELSYCLLLARDLGFLRPETFGELEAVRDHAGRLTWGLYHAIKKRSKP
jgi:four helix bundle protein